MAVLEARGMSLSGAVRRMVTLGILEHRIPFEVTRAPANTGSRVTSNRIARSQGRGRKTRGDSGPAKITGSTTRAPGKSAAQTAETR